MAFASDAVLQRHGLNAHSRGPTQFDSTQRVGELLMSVADIAAAYRNDTIWGQQAVADLQERPFNRCCSVCRIACMPCAAPDLSSLSHNAWGCTQLGAVQVP